MTRNGDVVKIKSEQYKVVGIGPASTDRKFFGRRRFTLREKGTDNVFVTYGKRVAHNSRLIKGVS